MPKLGARHQPAGTIAGVSRGGATTPAKFTVARNLVVTSAIDTGSAEALRRAIGGRVVAVTKPSDAMVGAEG